MFSTSFILSFLEVQSMKLLHRLFCTALLAVALSLSSSRGLLAQTPPPGVVCDAGWLLLSISTIIDQGFPCPPFAAEVWFCIPNPLGPILPKEQLVIKAVRKLGGGPFSCPLTGADIRGLGEHIMFDLNPGGWSISVDCSEWCEQHPECPCPAEYPQWVSSNGSCGKLVPEGDSTSVVMCGEISGPGQNCYYAYHVCKKADGTVVKQWVSKKTSTNCPGAGTSEDCVMPLCDNTNNPTPDPPDTCQPDDSGSVSLPGNGDLSGIGLYRDGKHQTATMVPGVYFDEAIREENE